MEDKYLCEACDAPLDDNFSLCDECFRVMPVDRMVSVSDIRKLRNRYIVHRGTGTYILERETEIVDLDAWATDSGFTRMSDDLYVSDETGHEWSDESLMAYMLEVTA